MGIYSGPVKKEIRKKVIATKKRNTAKIAVFMPAAECLCIREGLRQGTIDKNTLILAIDRDPQVCQQIRWTLFLLGFTKYQIYCGNLENSGYWLKQHGKGQIDYAFFDCCGECREAILEELAVQYKLFKKGADVAFTFTAFTRHANTEMFLDSTNKDIKDFDDADLLKGFGMFDCNPYSKKDEPFKASNTILWYLLGYYQHSKLTFFQEYRRDPTGKCVTMFSAKYLVR